MMASSLSNRSDIRQEPKERKEFLGEDVFQTDWFFSLIYLNIYLFNLIKCLLSANDGAKCKVAQRYNWIEDRESLCSQEDCW